MNDAAPHVDAIRPDRDVILAHLTRLFKGRTALTDVWLEISWTSKGDGPDRGRHFTPNRLEAAADFAIAQNNQGFNIYVGAALRQGSTVNENGADYGRASTKNFHSATYAWLDFDQPGDAEHAQKILTEKNMPPAFGVTTGTKPCLRCQLWFSLDKAATTVAELQPANEALQALFRADAVSDPIRVMRLAGTVSYPKTKKVERGYVVELTTFEEYTSRPYTLAELTALGGHAKQTKTKQSRTPDDLIALLELTKIPNHWHNNMLRAIIASMVGKRWTDEAIRVACGPYCKNGANDADLAPLIDSAREKGWGEQKPKPDTTPSASVGGNRNYELSDTGNAERLVDSYGEDLRYVPERKKWLVWKDGHWWFNIDGAVVRKAIRCTYDMLEEAQQAEDEDWGKALRAWAGKKNAARINAMVELARVNEAIVLSIEKIDADPMLLGVKNGVIDLRTQTFRAARREDYITKRCNVHFEPSAGCPNWIKFIERVLPKEMVPYIKRAVGYILTGEVGEEVTWIWWGDGANGKSTFRETIFDLMGDYAMAADATLLIERKNAGGGATPDLARLHGKRLVAVNETARGDVLNEARIKYITGQDTINARNLYEAPFDFKPTHKVITTTQHRPIIKGTDEGIWRRIHLWPFEFTIPKNERDVHFRQKVLVPEAPGILNLALEGLKDYQKQGLKPSTTVEDATKTYREDMDLISRWIEEECVKDEKAEEDMAEGKGLHTAFVRWSLKEINSAITKTKFTQDLKKLGFGQNVKKRLHPIVGLRLMTDQERWDVVEEGIQKV